ncbi:MAG: SGNH/GDSL hydrolase family protein [Planctomycetota bacterium]|nr:SGNH/GDSL hydrolase family protein [Planctomycetota bacterium]
MLFASDTPRDYDRPASRLWWPAALVLFAFGVGSWGGVSATVERGRDDLCRAVRSARDLDRLDRGYYTMLAEAGSPDGYGWLERSETPPPPAVATAPPAVDPEPFCLRVDDVREYVLKPSIDVVIAGRRWSTNALGMRDREYALAKPSRALRVALLGDSIANGWGVDDAGRFESRLEAAAGMKSRAAGGPRVEILNFAVHGHGPAARWEHFRRIGAGFDPDVVLFESTTADIGWDAMRLRVLLTRGVGFDVDAFRDVLSRGGISSGFDAGTYERLLKPLSGGLLDGVYREVAGRVHARGAVCILLILPRVGRGGDESARSVLRESALRAGFDEVVDVGDAFDDLDPATIAICRDDYHPNERGHARLADRIEAYLDHSPVWLGALARAGREPTDGNEDRRGARPRANAGADSCAEASR